MRKVLLAAGTILIAVVLSLTFGRILFGGPRVGYVENSKLMIGFSEASRADKEIRKHDEKWQEQLKVVQDSVQAAVDTMSKYFDSADPDDKRKLQDNLSAWNQRANNFKQANMQNSQKLRAEKMNAVAEKINVYVSEYGKKHGYDMILGTGQGGSILYGHDGIDITQEIVDGLNERYK